MSLDFPELGHVNARKYTQWYQVHYERDCLNAMIFIVFALPEPHETVEEQHARMPCWTHRHTQTHKNHTQTTAHTTHTTNTIAQVTEQGPPFLVHARLFFWGTAALFWKLYYMYATVHIRACTFAYDLHINTHTDEPFSGPFSNSRCAKWMSSRSLPFATEAIPNCCKNESRMNSGKACRGLPCASWSASLFILFCTHKHAYFTHGLEVMCLGM